MITLLIISNIFFICTIISYFYKYKKEQVFRRNSGAFKFGELTKEAQETFKSIKF